MRCLHFANEVYCRMKAVIVSDLHLGFRFSLSQQFKRFLENLPEGYDLILNGDLVHMQGNKLTQSDQQILGIIRKESFNREVVWVRGNHDSDFRMPNPGKIIFRQIHTIGKHLLIIHGDVFDKFWGRNQAIVKIVYFIYAIWTKLGGKEVNLARLARNFEIFNIFRRNLMRNAVKLAKTNGCAAVTCGHTHYSEDTVIHGIRYINTGSWTEWPPLYLLVNNQEIVLKTPDNPTN